MPLFPDTPKLTRADRHRLAPVIANAKACRKWLATDPSAVDIKRATLLEVESGRERGITTMLIVRLQKIERQAIWMQVSNHRYRNNV